MRTCDRCGALVDDWVRFHYARPFDDSETRGHYTRLDDSVARANPRALESAPSPNGGRRPRPANLEPYVSLWGDPPHRAPAPGPAPAFELWPSREEVLRLESLKLLRTFGYTCYDLEQGYRADGSTRVGVGIGDAYIQGHGHRAWIEWKRWDNAPTDAQLAFGLAEIEAGGCWLLVYDTAQLVAWHATVSRTAKKRRR